jgi:hypothetical protein
VRANWGNDARGFIADATKDLPETATIKERRAALRTVGWQFHMGTSWGKKVWSRECRKYLERHGLNPLPQRTVADISPQSKLFQRTQRGDIIFPFRGGSDGKLHER